MFFFFLLEKHNIFVEFYFRLSIRFSIFNFRRVLFPTVAHWGHSLNCKINIGIAKSTFNENCKIYTQQDAHAHHFAMRVRII